MTDASFLIQPMNSNLTFSPLCTIQGFLLSFFPLASLFWTCVITFVLFQMLKKRKTKLSHQEPIFHGLVWGTSAVLSVLPLIRGFYGPAGGWCWIAETDADGDRIGEAMAWRFIQYYGPLWVCIILICSVYGYIVYSLRQTIKAVSSASQKKVIKKKMKVLKRLALYPVIPIVTAIPFTIYRIMDVIYPQCPLFEVGIVAVAVGEMKGVMDSLVYAVNANVRRHLKQKLQRCGKKGEQEESPKKARRVTSSATSTKTISDSDLSSDETDGDELKSKSPLELPYRDTVDGNMVSSVASTSPILEAEKKGQI
eukprot:CAMPEP_0113901030 /NCGR_PEP_ID=MMETSP0780_2-20120614/21019_1 /TAXON_ID=652834 /ORGANISM="Palpitomonas bilix" /LENGTH=309 /DNA_ID=CAMNT_0000893581 /DNA_START=378 /DNA_END=1307 /DNA_ORIENTATION=+ /assembly_acc=CAM_ASM_000599